MKNNTKIIRSRAYSHETPNNSPVYLTSSFCLKNSKQAHELFSEQVVGNTYSRFTNPNVRLFEDQMAYLEGTEKAIAFASGMASLTAFFLSQLKSGDHIVAACDLFGSTISLISGLNRFGIESSFVCADDINSWEKAIQKNTKASC